MKFIMTGCIVGLLFVATSVNAAIINGDVSAGGTMGGGWLEYQHVGSGAYHTNDLDNDGLAGSSDVGWSLSASTLDKDGTTHKDRAGAAWFIGDVSGTDWRFEYDFSGTTNGSTDIVLYLGLDDGDNLATTRVMGFGNTSGPEDGVAVDDAWTIVTVTVTVGSDNSLALPDLTGFDIMVMKIINGETEGSFDNFELPARPASLAPNGATVPIGDVDLSWTNMDPNNPGDPVFVDVWFGTEPNELNPNYDMAPVISDPADGRNVEGVTVNAPVNGTYYWQVANYIYGDREGDPIGSPLASFIAVSDAAPTVQIDTPNTMTWSDEPVLLDWDWTDEGSPALSWGAEPNGIDDPDLNVEFFDVGPKQTEVAITNNTGSMVTVTVTLTVDDGNNDPVAASIELDVYPTACDMTRLGQGISDISDVNDDCVINLDDFAILIASKWLDDYSATEPAAR